MSALGKIWDGFRSLVNSVCGIFLIVVIAALDIQVLCRSFLGFSTTWSEEVAMMCFTGLIFCYLAQAEKEEAAPATGDYLSDHAPELNFG